jgi:hypothetical protein
MNRMPSLSSVALLLAVVVAIALRVPGMDRSLGHDEAFTAEAFASQPYAHIATSYAAPNNHILHTILVRLSIQALGKSNWTVRLPALAAGVAAVPAIWLVGRALFGSAAAGLAAAWILALIPVHVSYSQSARGYSLLVLLALLSLGAALRGISLANRRSWVAMGILAFLTAWTLPSGAFHLLALFAWAILLTDGVTRRHVLLTGALSGALVLLAYLPVREQMASAGTRWGVDVWQDPLLLADVFVRAVGGWIGDWFGLLPAISAAWGLIWMIRQRNRAALYVGLAWGSALLVALILGTAGQPRSYVYLLPTFVLAGASGICHAVTASRWRVAAVVVLLAGYGWVGVRSMNHTQTDPYAALASRLASATRGGDIVVTPFIMDVRVWSYARDTIGQRLMDALQNGNVDSMLFVTSTDETRFQLGSYLLKTNVGSASIALSERYFERSYALGFLQTWRLRSQATHAFPTSAQVGWRILPSHEAQQVSVTAAPSALGLAPAIDVSNPDSAPFQLFSTERFAIDQPGLLLLVYAKTFRDSYASVYSVGDTGRLDRPHMYRTSAWPAVLRGRDGETWYVDAYLLPVDGGVQHGVYILGGDVPQQRFADVACYFFAYPDSP